MTRFTWTRGALALAFALGMGGATPVLAEGEAGSLTIQNLGFQLSAADDEEYPGAFMVSFELTGGDLGSATGFVVEDEADGMAVFQDGYLDPGDDEGTLVGMGAWSVGSGDCASTRNFKVVVVSEEFTDDGESKVTRLAESSGSIEVPASYCADLGLGTED